VSPFLAVQAMVARNDGSQTMVLLVPSVFVTHGGPAPLSDFGSSRSNTIVGGFVAVVIFGVHDRVGVVMKAIFTFLTGLDVTRRTSPLLFTEDMGLRQGEVLPPEIVARVL